MKLSLTRFLSTILINNGALFYDFICFAVTLTIKKQCDRPKSLNSSWQNSHNNVPKLERRLTFKWGLSFPKIRTDFPLWSIPTLRYVEK